MTQQEIDKLKIAGMHAEAALQMMAVCCNPFSIHLPVMACSEIVTTIAAKRGVTLPLDFEHMIREDRLAEWRRAQVRAYNFFKHADRDAEAKMSADDLDRIEQLNDLTMIANLGHLHALGHSMDKVYLGYTASIVLLYPRLMNWEKLDAEIPHLATTRARLDNVSRSTLMEAMRISLRDAGSLPTDTYR